ncbi:MAG: glycosyltransferase [Oscillatoriales cyanobacterium]|nr:MAG: glycosyltransferase [Oscillatoriales cyanobacterium]
MAVIPWGANLDPIPDRAIVQTAIHDRRHDTLELLFLGKEWERKGGELTVNIVAALHDRGIPVRLTIIGSTPIIPPDLAACVRSFGYLNKNKATDRDRLYQTLLNAHALLLPTHAETYGHVFCEAAAFGLPAITTRVGGVPTIIHDGMSGYTFEPGTPAERYATTIAELWHDRDRYERLAYQAREAFETRLNWAIACQQMRDRLDRLI